MPPIKKNQSLKRLGEAIRIERKAQGISQEELALRSDINRSYMGSVERGEVNVSILTLDKVLEVLKRKHSELFKSAGL